MNLKYLQFTHLPTYPVTYLPLPSTTVRTVLLIAHELSATFFTVFLLSITTNENSIYTSLIYFTFLKSIVNQLIDRMGPNYLGGNE